QGVEVEWTKILPPGRTIPLPTYAFQHQRFWVSPPPIRTDAAAAVPDQGRAGAEFWDVVDRGDVQALVADLGVDAETPLRELVPALSEWRRRRDQDAMTDQWRYRVVWRALRPTRAAATQGRWLVVVPSGVAAAQEIAGQVADVLATVEGPARILDLDAAAPDRTAWTALLATHTDNDTTGIVSLLAMAHDDGSGVGVWATMVLAQAVLDSGRAWRLWALTQGAVGTGAGDPVQNPVQAQTWGAGRVIALEHPGLWGGLIDLPSTATGEVIRRDLAALIVGRSDEDGDGEDRGGGAAGGRAEREDQIALRHEGTYGRRLVRAPSSGKPDAWRPSGPVLITGGTGGLGAHVARWMATHGAEHLVLVSRRGQDAPGAAHLHAELERLGARVTIAACDIADRTALATLLNKLRTDGDAIRTVVHTAGVVSYHQVKDLDAAEVSRVITAKVMGAVLLDELLGDTSLDAFVLFSSNAGVWGSGSQAHYAAANAFLDGFAEWRRARGKPGTSLAWGAWAGAGMVIETGSGELLQRQGVLAMDPALAVAALVRALEDDERFLAVADIDWDAFAPTFTAHRRSPLISEIEEVREALDVPVVAEAPGKSVTELDQRLLSSDVNELFDVVLGLVREGVAAVLGFESADAAEAKRDFRELGFDSLTAVQLRNRLNTVTGLRLSVTVVFDHPNSEALARFVCDALSAKTARE
ncbi:SDR family NAD(P)-dependent oxidoreductase, partial [Streptomyces odontomachi]|uniref:SDR family NAD(P)-dependent oxidoreductase n=1 Tax=Streptomyces odontomachi TaxID=2944940 RepID=UPI00210BE7E7